MFSNTFSISSPSSSSGTAMTRMLEYLKISWRFLRLSSFFWILVSSFCSGWMFLSSFCSKPEGWFESWFLSCHCWFPVDFYLFHIMQPSLLPGSFLCCWSTQWVPGTSWLPVFWTVHPVGWLSLHCLVIFFLELWSVLSFGPFFSLSALLLCSKGQSLRCSPGRGNPHHCIVMLYVREGSEREPRLLLHSLQVFSHFPLNPQSN